MKRTLLTIGILVAGLTAAAAYYGYRRATEVTSVWVVLAFGLLMIPYFALGFDRVVEALREMGRSNRVRLTLMGFLLLVPGLVVLVGGGGHLSLRRTLGLVLYIGAPILLLAAWGRGGARPSVVDLLVLLLLWLPVELQYFEKFWNLPAGNPSYVLAKTLGMELALFCFMVVRRLDGVGYRFRLSTEDVSVGLIALLAFLAIGIPTALATGFVQFSPHWVGPGKSFLMFLGIFFFVALPEEVLFRGLIFNMLQRMIRTGGPYTSLLISSVIFGLAHLNNPPGDWRYVMLATAAGMCYGWAYLRTGSLLAAAYAHALVDTIGMMAFPH
ncbi:MAG TPA: CPBP family intramembrane glutamic endopeptidase [Candidatus Polarisedimenticolia bacterium]